MRPDSRPVNLTLNLPPPTDEAVVEIRNFLYEVIELFTIRYGHQVDRFYEDNSYDKPCSSRSELAAS